MVVAEHAGLQRRHPGARRLGGARMAHEATDLLDARVEAVAEGDGLLLADRAGVEQVVEQRHGHRQQAGRAAERHLPAAEAARRCPCPACCACSWRLPLPRRRQAPAGLQGQPQRAQEGRRHRRLRQAEAQRRLEGRLHQPPALRPQRRQHQHRHGAQEPGRALSPPRQQQHQRAEVGRAQQPHRHPLPAAEAQARQQEARLVRQVLEPDGQQLAEGHVGRHQAEGHRQPAQVVEPVGRAVRMAEGEQRPGGHGGVEAGHEEVGAEEAAGPSGVERHDQVHADQREDERVDEHQHAGQRAALGCGAAT